MRSRVPLVKGVMPVLIGAVASVGFARSGFLSPFFLVPIAFAALRFGSRTAALTALAASAANASFSAASAFAHPSAMNGFLADALYFAVVSLAFCWAAARDGWNGGSRRVRLAYRIIAAAVLATVATIPVILLAKHDEGLVALIRRQAEAFVAAYTDAAGADVVQRSLIERSLNPEAIIQAMSSVYVRGAAVTGHAVFFFVSWRVAFMFASIGNPSLMKRGAFARFRLEAFVVWPLIAAFAIVLAALVLKIVPVEIFGWNLLSLVLLLYLAQGYGIIQYHLAGPGVPRSIGFLVTLVVALALLRPGINAFVAGGIAVLGIAENWLPLRAPRKNEPPSTPEA